MTGYGYLVKYGRAGFLGEFIAIDGDCFARGQAVVVRSPRGLEVGEVLCPAEESFAPLVGTEMPGELLRAASPADDAAARELTIKGETLLAQARNLADEMGLSMALLDVEVLFDGTSAVLHAIHWAECEATPLF